MIDIIIVFALLLAPLIPFATALIVHPIEADSKNLFCKYTGHKVPKVKEGSWSFFTCERCGDRSVCYGGKDQK